VPALPAPARRRTPHLARGLRWPAVAALSLVLATGSTTASALDDDGVPSEEDVAAAQRHASERARDVSAVQADLVLANERLRQAGVTAAQAAEAYNGARWQADEARRSARAATAAAEAARADVQRQQDAYSDSLVRSYEVSPGIQGFAAVVGSDGIQTMIDRTTTMQNAEDALDGQYDAFRAAATIADVASTQADDALAEAERLEARAEEARAGAAAAEAEAGATAESIAVAKTALIAELAELQGISVRLAEKRQSALEQAAAEAAAKAAQQAAEQAAAEQAAADAAAAAEQAAAEAAAQAAQEAADKAAQKAAEKAAQEAAQAQQQASPTPSPTKAPSPTPSPTSTPTQAPKPTPTPTQTPSTPEPTTPEPTTSTPAPAPPAPPAPAPAPPAPAPTTPPAPAPPPATGAAAAIAFATAQIGDPYQWGAAGPDAWDCSGLTAGAWAKGGKYLPHYSVAQFTGSTRITAAQLAPGDLVFWGSSSNPSSIYHVGLYVGGGQMIHAPRTGRPVVKESIYSWTAPNFFARP
jgi:peptidoglycan DL-endopeptidase CwlO